MSREEMLLESIRNYFHLKGTYFSFDVLLEDGVVLERIQ